MEEKAAPQGVGRSSTTQRRKRKAAPPTGGETTPHYRGREKREESATTHKTDWKWKTAPSTFVSGSRECLPRKRSCQFGQLGSIWPVFLLRENTTKNEEWKAAPLQSRERPGNSATHKGKRNHHFTSLHSTPLFTFTFWTFLPCLLGFWNLLENLCFSHVSPCCPLFALFSFLTTLTFCCPLHLFLPCLHFLRLSFLLVYFTLFWTPCLPLFTH